MRPQVYLPSSVGYFLTMTFMNTFRLSSAICLVCILAIFASANPVLRIDTAKVAAHVSPTLYGLMTEEINYSYDGGLYAELIRNRTFRSDWTGILNWYLVEKGGASAKVSVDSKEGPSAALPHSARLDVAKADKIGRAHV